ncbi:hypothetical protein [Tunturiibacter gelidiferens]|uniref:hypothetical protein n=1 Tax=Tunturiibacter gelidiferens TaxID=3069689 RepID=UPI003D9B6F8E
MSTARFLSEYSRIHDFGHDFSSADFQRGIASFGIAILGFGLIGLMVMDWQTMILPDSFTLGGIAIALFLVCTQALFLGPNEDEVVLTKHHIQLTSPGGVVDRGNLFLPVQRA